MTDKGHGQKEKFAKTFGSGNIAATTSKFRLNVDSGIDTLDQSYTPIWDAAAGATPQWQSITPGLSGSLTKVSIENASGIGATNCTVSIFEGIGINGRLIAQETGISAAHNVLTDVPITTPPEVLSTSVITMQVSGTDWAWGIKTVGGYGGGSYKGGSSDAVFRTYVDTGYNFEFTSGGSLLYDAPALNLSGIPLVLANVSSQVNDVTGDGTLVTLPCDNEIVDHGNRYNNVTFIFTATETGIYEVNPQLWLRAIAAAHTAGVVYITTTSDSYRIYQGNPNNEKGTGNDFAINSKIMTKLTATDTVQCQFAISGGTKTVDIGVIGTTQLAIKLISIS